MRPSFQRTVQLGLLARDLAAVRTRRPGLRRDAARRRLVERLGLLHGLPQKIGQLLAFSEVESADPLFGQLTENKPSLTAMEARAELSRRLGGPVSRFFASFEPVGIAASIGQVHRATLPDGRIVAVKIQHPGIAEMIEYDLRALGWLTAPVGDLRRGFDLKAYRMEIGESLRRELDYRMEAAALDHFTRWARTLAAPIALPAVVPELSGEHLLTTTWLFGESLPAARQWPVADRAALSASLIELFCKGAFEWGVLHADPHPGNYRFLRCEDRPTIGLLDFGCVKQVPPSLQAGMRGLVQDALRGEVGEGSVRVRFTQMGFNPDVLVSLGPRLAVIGAVLTEPFTVAGKFDASHWDLGERLSAVLGGDRLTFRTGGPAEMIFVLRAFQGLVHYLKLLDAPVNWREAAALEAAPRADRPPVLLAPVASPYSPVPMLSETLHICVRENNVTKVALAFGASATDHLADLVPHDLRSRLAERAIDLAVIIAGARGRHYAPGELFSFVDGTKAVRVWLE